MSKSVIVVGAGAAGLACASALAAEGVEVTVLEARDRFGGRIFTEHHPGLAAPIELGAEFVHGKPPQILGLAKAAKQEIIATAGEQWCKEQDGLFACDFFDKVEKLLDKMRQNASPDCAFSAFLEQLPREEGDERVRRRALEYVSGFNAADPDRISVRSLIKDMDRTDALGGDAAHRIRSGYSALVGWLESECMRFGARLQRSHTVRRVDYRSDRVVVSGQNASAGFEHEADSVVVTVPVSLLYSNTSSSITFEPALPESKLAALRGSILGPVMRVVLLFQHPFWQQLKGSDSRALAKMRFLFSHDPYFPTWWTQNPVEAPMLVAWSAGPRAHQFRGWSADRVVEQALASLSNILPISKGELELLFQQGFLHDWQADPFSLGAYSYLSVGAADAPEELARPIADRLFFAGEATDVDGDHATVHGALASGHRAADQVLSVLR